MQLCHFGPLSEGLEQTQYIRSCILENSSLTDVLADTSAMLRTYKIKQRICYGIADVRFSSCGSVHLGAIKSSQHRRLFKFHHAHVYFLYPYEYAYTTGYVAESPPRMPTWFRIDCPSRTLQRRLIERMHCTLRASWQQFAQRPRLR